MEQAFYSRYRSRVRAPAECVTGIQQRVSMGVQRRSGLAGARNDGRGVGRSCCTMATVDAAHRTAVLPRGEPRVPVAWGHTARGQPVCGSAAPREHRPAPALWKRCLPAHGPGAERTSARRAFLCHWLVDVEPVLGPGGVARAHVHSECTGNSATVHRHVEGIAHSGRSVQRAVGVRQTLAERP